MDIINVESPVKFYEITIEYPTGLYIYCHPSEEGLVLKYIKNKKLELILQTGRWGSYVTVGDINIQFPRDYGDLYEDINRPPSSYNIYEHWFISVGSILLGRNDDGFYINYDIKDRTDSQIVNYYNNYDQFMEECNNILRRHAYTIDYSTGDITMLYIFLYNFLDNYKMSSGENQCNYFYNSDILDLLLILVDNYPPFTLQMQILSKHNKPHEIAYKHIDKDYSNRRDKRRKTQSDYRKEARYEESLRRRGINIHERIYGNVD